MGKGLTVRGVVEGDSDRHTFIPSLVELWSRGDLPLDRLISTYSFDDFPLAWADAKAGRVVKPVLRTAG
jgi:aryl-alcohol dehydrogenase